MTANILILDDEPQIRSLLTRILKTDGYTFADASSAEDARELMKKGSFELMLCDINLPGESGLDFARFALTEFPDTAVIMITGQDDPGSTKNAIDIGAYDYITKPFERQRVSFSVANALKRRELGIANRSYREDLENMVLKRTVKLEEINAQLREEISERTHTQKVLRDSEQKYRLLVDSIPGCVYKGFKDWSVDFIDNKVGELTGYDKTLFDDRTLKWSDIIVDQDLESTTRMVKQALKEDDAYIREYRIKTRTGKALWLQDRGQVVRNEEGGVEYVSGVFFDTTEQKRMEDALLKSEEKYRFLVNHAGDAIFIVQDDTIKFSNPKTMEITGYAAEELPDIPLVKLIHPEDRDTVFEAYKKLLKGKRSPDALSFRIINKSGKEVWTQLNTTPITWEGNPATLNFLRDISALNQAEEEKKRIESQLLQTEKMASIGQLAAGVAHEINNPTGFVSSNLKTLSDYIKDIGDLSQEYRKLVAKLDQSSNAVDLGDVLEHVKRITDLETEVDADFVLKDIGELIEESKSGLDRIKKIVQDLKDFAHPGEDKPKFADINQNMDSTINVVWNELKYKTEVTKDYGSLPQVRCYPQLLNQVFVNLLVNAAQSIEERGEIKIRTRADDGHVEIRISDTGCGIPKEKLPRIFDPFFTTKDVGKGTGLGLNVAYNIIEKHHGKIDVKSDVGKGTTFTIRIPTEQSNAEGIDGNTGDG